MDEPLLIGIDLGTTNAKVTCYDMAGRLQAESIQPHPTRMPRPGCFEQDPRDWQTTLERGLCQVAGQLGRRAASVAGISLSTFGPGLVLTGPSNEILAPCPTWQDERCEPHGRRLVQAVGNGWIGLGPALMSFPARLLWVKEAMPEIWAQTARAGDIKSFLLGWLTGEWATDPSSGPGAAAWCQPVFDYIGWPVERLPKLVQSDQIVAGLNTEIARRTGLPAGTPVFTGVNDGAAATLGCGTVHLGDSVITLATNGVCRMVIPHRLAPDDVLERNMFTWPIVENRWVCGGFTRSGAGSLQWLADQFDVKRETQAYDALLAEAARIPPGAHGVVFLPYLAGRGTPHADLELRGGFVHLGLEHGRAEMVRALLEGITFALAEIYAEFTNLGMQVGPLHITGGGGRSKLWRQIIANVLDRPTTYSEGDSTLGDAMIAAVGLGLYSSIEAAAGGMVHPLDGEEPQAGAVQVYRDVLEAFTGTRRALLQAVRYRGPAAVETQVEEAWN